MSVSGDILDILEQQREEQRLQEFLVIKGYSDPNDNSFGLNQWTRRLIPYFFSSERNQQESVGFQPNQLVSFLAIPCNWGDEIVDTNSIELRNWISEYKGEEIHGLPSPFPNIKVKACNEGLIIPKWRGDSEKEGLDYFLMINRDGTLEFGLGRNVCFTDEEDVVFSFGLIVERLWQFLTFLNDLYRKFSPNFSEETRIILNMRGTEEALLGNLAKGWKQPVPKGHNTYRPRCLETHLQIHRGISTSMSANDIDDVVRWFATRIDNAWGEFGLGVMIVKTKMRHNLL